MNPRAPKSMSGILEGFRVQGLGRDLSSDAPSVLRRLETLSP